MSKKIPLNSLLTLQTLPAHVSWELETLHWGNNVIVAISFPSDCFLCVFLCFQIQRTLGSYWVFHYMCTAGLQPRPVSPIMQAEKEIPLAENTSGLLPSCWIRYQRMLWHVVTCHTIAKTKKQSFALYHLEPQ